MRLKQFQLIWLIAAVLSVHGARAETIINPDELPHKIITLPNGTSCTVVVYRERTWRVVSPSVLAGSDISDGDVCFEAKFDSVIPPDRMKLYATTGTLIIDEKPKIKAASEFKRLDNLWLCGTLRQGANGKVAFYVNEMLKLQPDAQRFESSINALEKAGNAAALIETGQRIDQRLKENTLDDFGTFGKLTELRNRAFDAALTIKEQTVKPDDADGLFALAVAFKELRNKNAKYHEYVMKCLQADPDHRKAGLVAEQEFKLVKFEGKYVRPDEVERVMGERETNRKRAEAAAVVEKEAQLKEREQAAANRQARLLGYLSALRSSESKARESAISTLGEAAQKSVDPGFSEEAVDVLANMDDPAAIDAGLALAGKSAFPEVRTRVFDALAWRCGIQNSSAQKARLVFGEILKAEKNEHAAKAGVQAVKSLPNKAAVNILMEGLNADEPLVAGAVMDGLRSVTSQTLAGKQAWLEWWKNNKSNFAVD